MNKKRIGLISITAIALITLGVFAGSSYKTQADEKDMGQIANDIKDEVTRDLDEKYTEQLANKDKEIEDLKAQVNKQNDTINQLNENIKNTKVEEKPTTTPDTTNSATKEDLNSAKQEVKEEIKKGDDDVRSQITYENIEKDRQQKIKESGNIPPKETDKDKSVDPLQPTNQK